ncbi:hypothetical protein Aperf_G00000002342 [Anoplocephala perfoliata]
MASKLHYVLFENVTGYSLILVKEFDEIVRKFSAHVNSFLKPVAFVPFGSVSEALENVECISEGRVSPLLSKFLRQNLPVKDAILGVADQDLGESILGLGVGFECIWDSSVRELLRVVRANSTKLLRTLAIQPGAVVTSLNSSKTSAQETVPSKKAERRARLVVALTRARIQLDLVQHLADTGVVKSLQLLDNMDSNLAKSVKHLRTSYGVHFPELCHNGGLPGLDDFAFASIVTHAPLREDLVKDRDKLVEWLDGNQALADSIISLARSSIGQDLSSDDMKVIQEYGKFLLKLLKSRSECCQLLESRVRSLVPNLTGLMDQALPGQDNAGCLERTRTVGDRVSPAIVAARLISHAVTLDRLARMTSSRVDSLGASKSLFRRGGAAAAAASGLLQRTISCHSSQRQGGSSTEPGNDAAVSTLTKALIEMSGGRLHPIVVRRKAARILAAKSTLAVRADCYRQMNPLASEKLEVPKKLESGDYGKSLGQEVKRQLRVWAETNGVHLERTVEELEKQREKRKKYRKAKRKKWLQRKLAGVSCPTESAKNAADSEVVENGVSSSDDESDSSDERLKQTSSEKPAVKTLTLPNLNCPKVLESSNAEEVNDVPERAIDEPLSSMSSKLHENESESDKEKDSANENLETQVDGRGRKRRARGGKVRTRSSKRLKMNRSPERRVLRSTTSAEVTVKQ